MRNLTDKQSKFISEYLIDLNATQASIRAGYSKETAKQIGSENLSKPAISTAIAEALESGAKRNNVRVDEITRMHRKAFDVGYAQGQASAMTQSAQNLAKLHGLIADKQEQVGDIHLNIIKGFL
jgi:phage terminase small subunit